MIGQVDRQPVRLMWVTVVCWLVALAGGAVIVAYAADANIYRCPDGWTNRGQAQWGHVIGALIFTAPALGVAAWLAVGPKGSVRLRWVAVAIAVAVPLLTILLALSVLPDAPTSPGVCFD